MIAALVDHDKRSQYLEDTKALAVNFRHGKPIDLERKPSVVTEKNHEKVIYPWPF